MDDRLSDLWEPWSFDCLTEACIDEVEFRLDLMELRTDGRQRSACQCAKRATVRALLLEEDDDE